MNVEAYEAAIDSTRTVLANTDATALDRSTPCSRWAVRDLINHLVGGQAFFHAGITGTALDGADVDYASGDFHAEYDALAAQALAAFREDGALERTCDLPFGQMPGEAFAGLAATDTFTHGWDLARATSQPTDLAPELAAQLLVGTRAMIQPAFRSDDGAIFGPEREAPAGASNADQLAAFLGRTV